jgi:hypothetical protein
MVKRQRMRKCATVVGVVLPSSDFASCGQLCGDGARHPRTAPGRVEAHGVVPHLASSAAHIRVAQIVPV